MTDLSLQHLPFSSYGSWLSLSPLQHRTDKVDETDTLYLRSHHGTRPGVIKAFLQLKPITKAASKVQVTPAAVRWSGADGGSVEICYDTPRSLRLRGWGMGLTLTPCYESVLFEQEGRLVLNVFEVSRKYVLEALQGGLEARGTWRASAEEHAEQDARITLQPDDTGVWELALHEVQSTFVPEPYRDFAECRARAEQSFRSWHAATPPAPTKWHDARHVASYLTWSAVVNPEGLLQRPAVLMSKNWMSSVWSWDQCFNALALARLDSKLAWDQMLLMSDFQDEFGCYPDAVNDVEVIYNFTKPPIHGWTVSALLERTQPPEETLQTMYESLSRWTDWWLTYRVLPGEALPYYLHGNDSGWDNSTAFDEGVPLMTPDLSAYLILQMNALAELANRLDKPDGADWRRKANHLQKSLLNELWQGDHFAAKHASGKLVYSQSLLHHLPIVLAKLLPRNVLDALEENIAGFLTDHGLATERPDSAAYQADGYWRGPIWAPSTYLVVKGLETSGFNELARDVAERFCATCAASGFAENFDALSGEGLRDRAYTWTASVFLLLAESLAERNREPNSLPEKPIENVKPF